MKSDNHFCSNNTISNRLLQHFLKSLGKVKCEMEQCANGGKIARSRSSSGERWDWMRLGCTIKATWSRFKMQFCGCSGEDEFCERKSSIQMQSQVNMLGSNPTYKIWRSVVEFFCSFSLHNSPHFLSQSTTFFRLPPERRGRREKFSGWLRRAGHSFSSSTRVHGSDNERRLPIIQCC